MDSVVQILRVFLPVMYALAAANSVVVFVTRNEASLKAAKPLLGSTVALHAVSLGLRAALTGQCPLGTVFEAMGVMAFSLAAVHAILEFLRGTRPTGILILPLAFLLVLLSASFPAGPEETSPHLSDPWFSAHAASAVFAIAALAVSFVYGILYLLLYREIRDHRFGVVFRRLPPLAVMSRMTNLAAVVGFCLLTVTIAAGTLWAAGEGKPGELLRDPLSVVIAGAWVLYAVGLGVRFLAGWRGRYTVYLSVCGFALILICMLVVSIAFPSLHGGR
ncbi:MAG: cytochrome C assembly family protein [Planctomycetota bacterium]|jgi:ABC-type uncharacterized transport system permease subunit